MNFSFGPFNMYFLLTVLLALYLVSFYFIMKKKLGIVAVFIVFLFPFLGALGVITYGLLPNKSQHEF